MSKYRLPPLELFRTFEAVARHRSFTLAAGELCLTQSAVSRQIKTLEEALGVRLFRRLHRAIEVTAEGQRLFESVTRGLEDISACLAALGAAAKAPQITVSASVAFAWFWLMPRLERFGALQPDIDLRVLATDQPVLPGVGEVDVAILFGSGQWEGLETRLLFGERVYPVCSPDYLRDHPVLHRPEDLLDQTLLHLEYGKPSFGAWTGGRGCFGMASTASRFVAGCGSIPIPWCSRQPRLARGWPSAGAMSRTRSWLTGGWSAPWIARLKRRTGITSAHPKRPARHRASLLFCTGSVLKLPGRLMFA